MYLCYLFAIFLVIIRFNVTLTYDNISTIMTNNTIAKSSSTLKLQDKERIVSNETKTEIVSEGGSILPKISPMTLQSENHTNLIILDKETRKTKEKAIVPRKGVVYNPIENSASNIVDSRKDRVDTTVSKTNTINGKLNTLKAAHTNSSVTSHINVTNKSKQELSVHALSSKKPLNHKKPLVVSYETLSEMDKNTRSEFLMMPEVESSSKPIVSNQLPTPNVKVHPMSANRHPGMVMPIVITILVVPMFAVLGYMALRRGQEAWKNRHYKRMDFLLDGMYND